jgi:hypothetical protein
MMGRFVLALAALVAGAASASAPPAALGGHHKAEIDKWWPIIKGANIRVV